MEGIDGCGKTTQVDMLCETLAQRGIAFIRTREPGGTPIGDGIRSLLLNPSSDMLPLTETYLYAASRAEHVRRVILPALARGDIVVCDRFVDASIAYQGYGLQGDSLTPGLVNDINAHAVGGVMPDLTFMIDVPVDVAQERLRQSNRLLFAGADRIERRGTAFFERVRDGLWAISRENPTRVVLLDGTMSAEALRDLIWARISKIS